MYIAIVVLIIVSILVGMAISVSAFGTGGKRAKIFENIYFSCEDVKGMGVIYTKKGDYSVILKMENPVRKYSADIDSYYDFTSLMASIMQSLGEGYAIHKQDVFVRREFDMKAIAKNKKGGSNNFLSSSYFKFFNGRKYTDSETYLIVTQKGKKGGLGTYDKGKWRDFQVKAQKVYDRLKANEIRCSFMSAEECKTLADRFFAFDFVSENPSMTNFKVDAEKIGMGNNQIKVYSLLDVDNIGLPGHIRPFTEVSVNNATMPMDLLADIDHIPGVETAVYNQIVYLPNQKRENARLDLKSASNLNGNLNCSKELEHYAS